MDTQIALPKELHEKIAGRIAGSQFESVQKYVVYVLREVIAADEAGDDLMTQEQRVRIEKRLRNLGYFG